MNLLKNPGFEDGISLTACIDAETAAGRNSGWLYKLTQDTYIRSEAGKEFFYGPTGALHVKEGKDALYMGSLTGGKIAVYQEIMVQQSKPYYAAAWVKAYDADGMGFGVSGCDYAGIKIIEYDETGLKISEYKSESIKTRTEDYTQLVLSFKTAPTTSKILFILETNISFNHWHGCVRFDDCILTEAGE